MKILLIVCLTLCFGVIEGLTGNANAASKTSKMEYELTEVEILKLENIDYRVRDLQNQYANFKRNISSAFLATKKTKRDIIKSIEKRLNITPGEYEIKSGKVTILKKKSILKNKK